MNIAYITQITNLDISDNNPIDYLKSYDTGNFENVLDTHLVPRNGLEWARAEKMPGNALDIFIENRIDLILDNLKSKLCGINIEIIDTKETF